MSPIVYFVTVGCLPLLILNLGLHVVDGVRGLNLEGDSLAGEGLHENLHATTEAEHWMFDEHRRSKVDRG